MAAGFFQRLFVATAVLCQVFAVTVAVKAQQKGSGMNPKLAGLVIETNGFFGKQLPIYPDYTKNTCNGYFEIEAGYKCYGFRPWHEAWRYPQIGLSFIYGYLGNPQVLGNNYSLMPNITLESRDDRKLIVDLRLGTGLAWFDRIYDRIGNPDNIIVGSRIANMTYISVNLRKPLSKYLALWGGISFLHCSNGHYQLPNVGMNTPSVNFGLKYYPYGKPENIRSAEPPKAVDKRMMVNIRLGFGMHEFGSAVKPVGGPKYPVYLASVFASKRVGKISNLHAGVFITYYSSYYDFIISQEYYKEHERGRSFAVSVFVGHEFMIGRFGLVWQSGVNVYNPFQRDYYREAFGSSTSVKMKTYWCNKLGAQFYFLRPDNGKRFNAWFGAYIKSNLMTADFVETALGFRF